MTKLRSVNEVDNLAEPTKIKEESPFDREHRAELGLLAILETLDTPGKVKFLIKYEITLKEYDQLLDKYKRVLDRYHQEKEKGELK